MPEAEVYHGRGWVVTSGSGVDRIARERERQVTEERWSAEHDDQHTTGQLAAAAASYADLAQYQGAEPSGARYFIGTGEVPPSWPFEDTWWKPSQDPIRNLEKAGALIAAEIDRLLRAGSEEDR